MLPSDKSKFHPHNHHPKIKGCTIDYNGTCQFIQPGERYKDPHGKLYYVAEDGSLRRVKDGKK